MQPQFLGFDSPVAMIAAAAFLLLLAGSALGVIVLAIRNRTAAKKRQ